MMAPPPVTKRELWSWYLFDFANSSYTTLIVTVAYSIYFTQVVAAGREAEALWGRATSLSMLLIGLASPFLGAVADLTGQKKRFLIGLTLLCVAATGLMSLVGPGAVMLGLTLYVIANIGFNGCLTFYNAFLREIATEQEMGRISGYGWAVGYLGGLATLLLCFPLIAGGFAPENLLSFRLSFLVTALFFLVFSIPTMRWLRERAARREIHPWLLLGMGLTRVRDTLRRLRFYPDLLRFFVAYILYNDGTSTVIAFASIFAAGVLGFTPKELMIYFILTQLTSALGAWAMGPVTDWIGPKKTIAATLLVWIGVVVWASAVQDKGMFYLVGLTAGLVIGSNQAASRAMLALFTPPARSAEFFGFFSLTEKFSAILGPLVYGEVTLWTGSQRIAVLSVAGFFLVGLALLMFVNAARGMQAARLESASTLQ
jgi:UMF1 family MFS transporter